MRFFIVSYPLKLALKIITSLFPIALDQSNLQAIPAERNAYALDQFNLQAIAQEEQLLGYDSSCKYPILDLRVLNKRSQ
jgi:hypothetical protein